MANPAAVMQPKHRAAPRRAVQICKDRALGDAFSKGPCLFLMYLAYCGSFKI